jgi:glycosyltransferase involved in cell wall biosynthesis
VTVASPADVTVVIPARNAASTLGATLDSILRGSHPVAVIVVDDGSTDDTAAVASAAGPQVRVLRTEGVGPGAARNEGIAAAATPYVAFCDADDRWPPQRLADDLAAFETRPDIQVLLGRTRFDAEDPALLEGLHFDGDTPTSVIPHFGAATVRREVFGHTGPISEGLTNYEDYDWFLRVREVGCRVVVHDRVVMWRTMHAGSMSRRNPPTAADLLAVLQRSVVRRRTEGHPDAMPRLADLRHPMIGTSS